MLFVALVFFVARAEAQTSLNTRISIDVSQLSIPEILKVIEVENDFFFAYNSTYFTTEDKVSIHRKESSLRSVLNEVLSAKYDYKAIGNHIILVPKKEVELPREVFLNACITDDRGHPLDSVIVFAVKDQSISISDANGYVKVKLLSQSQYLSLSHTEFNDTLVLVDYFHDELAIQLRKNPQISIPVKIVRLDSRAPVMAETNIEFKNIALVNRLVSQEQIYISNHIKTKRYMPAQLSLLIIPKIHFMAHKYLV